MKRKNINEESAIVFAKILKVCAKIAQVGLIIGIVSLAISAVVVPIIGSNIKIGDNKIEVFGEKFEYRADDENDQIIFKTDKKDYKFSTEFNSTITINASKIVGLLNKLSVTTIIIVTEIVFVFTIAILAVMVHLFGHAYKIFKYISLKHTIFDEENADSLISICYDICITILLSVVLNLIVYSISDMDISITIGFGSLATAATVYIAAWLVEKGSVSEVKTPKKKNEEK